MTPSALSEEPEMYASTIAEMALDRKFFPSHKFIISCGTVTVDTRGKRVLLVYNKRHRIYQLPKGRKNIGEDLLAAALRETLEETAVAARPVTLRLRTRATPVSRPPGAPEVSEELVDTEPVAVCHYPDPASGAMKMVFYFVAERNFDVTPDGGTSEDRAKFDVVWVDAAKAADKLAFKEDGMVVEKALDDLRTSGYDV
ncbi:NUDIX domain-containing protein [Colletotrichum graminicola]|uniref:NUDIX domain-containing protein n=1 Tax=Colletotrichum graminicola (strain M1.001 / M2 / FGSC 10212) TaxID=645133 RepID=E3Q6X6_COLGM|nr:NUDIX domain-containing protein [Colletotrichum graminicola M1.001]EFQ26614.1 NUDIX domain-containing protein [Colletotrichum graminicola M1.001]WDK17899.1 NUDIX domain-containing protein [Colletotrichum graminicola]